MVALFEAQAKQQTLTSQQIEEEIVERLDVAVEHLMASPGNSGDRPNDLIMQLEFRKVKARLIQYLRFLKRRYRKAIDDNNVNLILTIHVPVHH